jgi:hypothetical protein
MHQFLTNQNGTFIILLTWPNFIGDDVTCNFGLRIAYDLRMIKVIADKLLYIYKVATRR